jgi:uncharacterized membrane protein (UPF0127 family)
MKEFLKFKKIILIFFLLVAGFFVWNQYSNSSVYLLKNYSTATIELPNNHKITAYKAISSEQHSKGLSGIVYLPSSEGMLFEFPYENLWNFWMKDMLIPIDIVWINKDMVVVHIEERVDPDTYPQSFGPSQNSLYVVELASGVVEKTNLKVGDKIIF